MCLGGQLYEDGVFEDNSNKMSQDIKARPFAAKENYKSQFYTAAQQQFHVVPH